MSMPLSGYERAYEPNIWKDMHVKGRTNCYAYALNLVRNPITGESFRMFSDPTGGYIQSGQLYYMDDAYLNAMSDTTGKALINLCIKDANAIGGIFKPVKRDEVCPVGTYKVALVLYPPGIGLKPDYHWYRQNPDGTWSHKSGHREAINTDTYNETAVDQIYPSLTIYDPLTANRMDYFVFVGYFAVKSIDSGAP